MFGKVPDADNQHWKSDLEVEQLRNALEQNENMSCGNPKKRV